MWQGVVVGILVALAAAWVVWSMLLPAKVRRSIRERLGRAAPKGGCDCGD